MIGLVLLLFILIRIPSVQNFVVQQVVSFLEKKIETPVKIERVSLDLPKLIVLEGVYFEDQKQDTLLSGQSLKVDISLLKLLNNKVEINEIDLKGITAKIDRTLPDSAFNFDYIIDAFITEQAKEPEPEDTTATMEFSIDKITLDTIRLVYHDDVIGTSADFNLGHFDTRIKTFDLNRMRYEIHKINIQGIHSTVKQWVVNPPKSEGPSPTQADSTAAMEMPDVKINQLNVGDIHLNYADEASALSAQIDFEKLLVDFKDIDLKGEKVDINRILFDRNTARIAFGKTKVDRSDQAGLPDTVTSEPTNWKVNIAELAINQNNIAYYDANTPRIQKGMDYGNLQITDFNTALSNFFFSIDSISGQVASLRFKDRSGLTVNQVKTDFAYTEHGVTAGNLYLETPNTLIQDYVKATYPDLATITDHIGEIGIEANIRKSKLGMKDVLLLVPDLDTMEIMQPLLTQTFYINGRVNGRVDNLNIPNIEFSTLDQTRLLASAHIKGLPDINKFHLDLQLKQFITSKGDIDRLVAKSMMPDSLELPNRLALRGNFKGGMNNFATQMHLLSSMGNADLDAKYIAAKDTSYDAQLSIRDIDVGHLMKMDSTLGKVSFAATVKGVGLDPKKAIANIQAKLIRAEAMGYTYSDIDLNAQAKAGDLSASLNSEDPNIRLGMKALVNFKGQYPTFKMDFLVDSINTKNLHLTTDSIRYHGKLTADFSSADLDNLNGRLDLSNSLVAYNNSRYLLDTISLIAQSDTSQNLIQLQSEFLAAHMIGKYKLTSLAAAFQDVLATYYNPTANTHTTGTVQDTITKYEPVQMEFGLTFTRSPLIIKVLPELTEMQPITLDGNFNSTEKSVNMKGVAPHLLYAGTLVDHVSFDLNTLDSTLYYATTIDKIKVSSIELTSTLLSGTVKDNVIDAGLWVKDTKGKEQYHLGINLLAEAEDFIFKLKEDGLMLNYDTWNVNPNNALIFGKNGLLARQFDLSHNGQEMHIASSDSTYNAPLKLNFNNFRIETFTNFIESNTFHIGGGINGDALVERLETSPVFTSNINISDFYFRQDTIGNINLQVNNVKENTYSADIRIEGNGNDIQLKGDYLSPPNTPASMNFVLAVNNLNMQTLEAFSFGNLRRTSGGIKGSLAITGTPNEPRINGDLVFDQAKLNISMLNATFVIDQQRINFSNRGLTFNQFTLQDSIGNKAIVNGNIRTRTYTDFTMALTARADDFQVLNSTELDNQLFYGQLNIDTDLQIRGGLTSAMVNGTLRVNENTNMTLTMPETDPGLIEREGIVEFTSLHPKDSLDRILAVKDSTMGPSNRVTGMNISLNIDVDRNAAFTVIVDPGTGDKLFVKGQALLNFGINPGGEMTLAGTYEVQEGNYSLSFNMIKRRFDFQKGSTITWGGDIMQAQLDLTAIYRIQAQPIDLVQNQVAGTQANYYRQRIPFDVILNIDGEMMKPIISFDINLGTGNSLNTVPQFVTQMVESRLAQIRDDQSEVNKQTFALIVLGRFVAENPFQSAGGSSTETMVRSSVSSLLTSQLNKLAGDLIAGVELNFDLQSTADDYSTGTAQNRTDLNVGVSKRLLDDRLKVTVGSNFELEGAQQPGQKASNIAGDISVEYQLSRDGRYVARVYRKNQYQVTLQGQFIETGLGFIINMNYDEFKELFMSAKRLQQLEEERQEELKKEMNLKNPEEQRRRRNQGNRDRQKESAPVENKNKDDSTRHDLQSFNKAYHKEDDHIQESETERSGDDQ